MIEYKIKSASESEIFTHLQKCNNDFIPPLDKKVNIRDYSKKIAEKAITFEAWNEKILVGLIAAYFNDAENIMGFITNVSTLKEYHGKGIASELLKMCMDYSKNNNFKEIFLEVSDKNSGAIHLYNKNGFKNIETKNGMLVMKFSIK